MAKQKKSRKVGKIGVAHSDKPKSPRPSAPKVKKSKGLASGSRNAPKSESRGTKANTAKQDPRVGSKKPVVLGKSASSERVLKKITPQQELDAIEADNKLAILLERVEDGQDLNKKEQQYVDQKLARHKILCELLGIEDVEEEIDEAESEQVDLIDQLDQDYLQEYKND